MKPKAYKCTKNRNILKEKMDPEMIFGVFVNYLTLNETMATLSNYRRLARLASFFWDHLIPQYKDVWKDQARQRNRMLNLHGRKRVKGFWLFAMTLRYSILMLDCTIFHEIWANYLPETRVMWTMCFLHALRNEMGLML